MAIAKDMAILLHSLTSDVRPRPIVFSKEYERRTVQEDRPILERIIESYHRGIAAAPAEERNAMYGTIWHLSGAGIDKQLELLKALEARSVESLHSVLSRFFVTDAASGIGLGRHEAQRIQEHESDRRLTGLMWVDRLVGFSFACGARPIPNPEDNIDDWDKRLEVDVDAVVDAIEKHVGIPLHFPEVSGVFGGELRGPPFPAIAFTHLLVALDVVRMAPLENPIIFEIGGGFGGLAHWVRKLMPCRYSIVDLPYTLALQAYFLWRANPDKKLLLFGEPVDEAVDFSLLPGWVFLAQPPAHTDLVVNQDSMPEMPRATARAYLRVMRKCLKGPFLSVNHESLAATPDLWDRTSVGVLIEAEGGYFKFSRSLFPLRAGYAQEVYYPTGEKRSPRQVVGDTVRRARRVMWRVKHILR